MNGIPNLLNSAANVLNPIASVTNVISLLVADAKGIMGFFSKPKWGLFNKGANALPMATFVGLEVIADSEITKAPIEEGSFQSYNRVKKPAELRVKLAKGGSADSRGDFLMAVAALKGNMTILNLSIPEGRYSTPLVITRYNYSRTSTNGVSLLTVEVTLEEVRQTVTTTYSNTAEPSGADPVNGGSVQPKDEGIGTGNPYNKPGMLGRTVVQGQ